VSKLLKLSPEVHLPLKAITERLAFLGQSGSGKTYAAMRLAELMLEVLAQIIVLDPMGVWWGLRSTSDGKSSGFAVTVFGGRHGDVPITPEAGALIAQVIFERQISAVVDVSLMTVSDRVMFVSAFAERLFELFASDPRPAHLFLEEAHEFLPQNLPPEARGGGDPRRNPAVMLNRVDRIVRQGRSQGIGCSMISQQPQAVSKRALNQAGTVFAMRMMGKHERKAISEWMADKATDESQLNLDTKLPKLTTGESWVASPELLGSFVLTKISKRTTFDSSSTPEFGSKAREPKVLAKIDVEKLGEAIAELSAKAHADDPKALHKRIAELERELKKKHPAAPAPKPGKTKIVEVPVVKPRERAAIERLAKQLELAHKAIAALPDKLSPMRITAVDLQAKLTQVLTAKVDEPRKLVVPPPNGHAGAKVAEGFKQWLKPADRHLATQQIRNATKVEYSDKGEAPPTSIDQLETGQRKLLEIVAGFHPEPINRDKLSRLAGLWPGHGSFRTWLPKLQTLGLVTYPRGGDVSLTPAGEQLAAHAIGNVPATGQALVEFWLSKLEEGQARMLRAVLAHGGKSISREQLAADLGMHTGHGSFRTWLPRLQVMGLVSYPRGGDVTPAPELLGGAA
jgi:hypothetical protein